MTLEIKIEFYGIARQRAQISDTLISDVQNAIPLHQVLRHLANKFPDLNGECIADDQLQPGFVANLNGEQFVTNPDHRIRPGESILIMSADAGG